jgi:hypothetical protein
MFLPELKIMKTCIWFVWLYTGLNLHWFHKTLSRKAVVECATIGVKLVCTLIFKTLSLGFYQASNHAWVTTGFICELRMQIIATECWKFLVSCSLNELREYSIHVINDLF